MEDQPPNTYHIYKKRPSVGEFTKIPSSEAKPSLDQFETIMSSPDQPLEQWRGLCGLIGSRVQRLHLNKKQTLTSQC